MPLKRLTRTLTIGWSGFTTAVREIAQRTDRSVQFAKLRLDQWEMARELTLAYRSFGQRLAELAGPGQAPDQPIHDDPEIQRLLSAIGKIRMRLDDMTQQLASLHLEEPEQAAFSLRRKMRAVGLAEMTATIPAMSPYTGKRMADLPRRGEWIAVALFRRGTPFIPDGSTTLMAGDELLLVGPAMTCEQAKVMLEQSELPPDQAPAV